jgi:hypothetical protein
MAEPRRLTPSEIKAISLEVRNDFLAAAEEARQIGQELNEQSRNRAREVLARLPPPSKLPKV